MLAPHDRHTDIINAYVENHFLSKVVLSLYLISLRKFKSKSFPNWFYYSNYPMVSVSRKH